MAVLDKINSPEDIKKLKVKELDVLADELRSIIIETARKNGGHLSSNLGTVELTIALYYVFDFPKDKLIFDVGHQCYAHKILSGRKDEFDSIRTSGGLSGFPDKSESEFDAFTTGHAGTSLSAGLGYCKAREKKGENYRVINLVGDASFTNGLNLEAITSFNDKPKNFLVILNDNGMSISKNKNGLYKLISKGTTKKTYIKGKKAFKKIFRESFITKIFRKIKTFIKLVLNKNAYFEKFGFKYVGVYNGNSVSEMVDVLSHLKENLKEEAVFLHVKTTKGKGHVSAEEKPSDYHGVGKDLKNKKSAFSECLGSELCKIIEENKDVVAVTAGMKDGTGLRKVEETHPENFIDVGIAEEYAVTLSAGMSAGGIKPVVCLYSTFMQRAYDQILHDVCIPNLPVVFCIDRAGLIGADGKTHQGVFDLSFLTHMPNMKILAPSNLSEFKDMLRYALLETSPVAIRYPATAEVSEEGYEVFESPKFNLLSKGKDVNILAVGPRTLEIALEIEKEFSDKVGVINARTIKPLDEEVLLAIKDTTVVTLEENSLIGGFGSLVKGFYSNKGLCTSVLSYGVKDEFVAHGDVNKQFETNGLTASAVIKDLEKILKG